MPEAKTKASRSWFGHTSERIQGQIHRFLSPIKPPVPLRYVRLKSRLVYIVKSVALKIISISANHLIKAAIRLEDALVKAINTVKGQLPKPEEQRQTLFTHWIFPHAETIRGIRYPHGIPDKDIRLYTNPTLLVVEGGKINRYGHAVIMFGDPSSGTERYVQISSGNNYPEHMTSEEFDNFLKRWKCRVGYELKLPVTDDKLVQKAVNALSMEKWRWGGPTQNCLVFAYRLVDASGGDSSLLKQFDTVSNEYPNLAIQGFREAISRIVDNLQGLDNPDMINAQLSEAVDLAAENIACNPAIPGSFFNDVMNEVLNKLADLHLPREKYKQLKMELKTNCIPQALEFIENSAVEFTKSIQCHVADLPLDAARNMPVGLRNVGPQSRRGFNEDNL